MRILFSHRIRSRDGQAVHVEELVQAFREEGHEVLVIGPPSFERTDFGGEGQALSVFRRLCPAVVYELLELAYNIPSAWRLWRGCRRFRPDCIYERYNLFFFAGVFVKRLCGRPLHLEVNSPLASERAAHGGLALKGLAARLERWVWRSADHLYPVTGVLADRLRRAGVSPDAITVNQNGADLSDCAPTPLNDTTTAPVTLGFVGFLRPWHGLDAAIAAVADQPNGVLRLVIVGDGPARSALERQVAALGIADRVDFLGLVTRRDIGQAIRNFDIALQPKAVPYASPLKLFEYMALGRAIVAPNQPNIREILTHERDALLFAPDDTEAMRRAIIRLAADPALRARLGSAARQALLDRDYTWRGNARRVASMMSRGLGRTQPVMPAATNDPAFNR